MEIIIIGNGKVGYTIAKELSSESNNVTVVDRNYEALQRASEELDVMTVFGNGLSTRALIDAGVHGADLLIAVTASDEVNMVACMTARKLGAKHTIARIRDLEYADELTLLKNDLGLDLVINPDQASAAEIARLVQHRAANNVETFAKGRVEMVELTVTDKLLLDGMYLRDIPSRIASDILIGGIFRQDEFSIPKGDFRMMTDDHLYILGQPKSINHFLRKAGLPVQKLNSAILMGGSRLTVYTARYLLSMGVHCKVIEQSLERCRELTGQLPEALIIHGDGSDEQLLLSENIEDTDVFITASGRDEENLISAMIAKQLGVKKCIAKISRLANSQTFYKLGIDSIVAPKLITVDEIVRYVRGLKNAWGNPANALYTIMNNQAEVSEFTADDDTLFLNKPLMEIPFPDDVLVAAIVHENKVRIAHGQDSIHSGDSVIIISKKHLIQDLNDIVRGDS